MKFRDAAELCVVHNENAPIRDLHHGENEQNGTKTKWKTEKKRHDRKKGNLQTSQCQ